MGQMSKPAYLRRYNVLYRLKSLSTFWKTLHPLFFIYVRTWSGGLFCPIAYFCYCKCTRMVPVFHNRFNNRITSIIRNRVSDSVSIFWYFRLGTISGNEVFKMFKMMLLFIKVISFQTKMAWHFSKRFYCLVYF